MVIGKDIKIGDDKRPVSFIPGNLVPLYNIANGEILTDEFGNPLVVEVDEYYLPDATQARSTSVTFGIDSSSSTELRRSTIATPTATYSSGATNIVGLTTTGIKPGDYISGASIPNGTIVSRIGTGSIFISNDTTNSASLSEGVLIERIQSVVVKSNPILKVAEQFVETSEVSSTLLGVDRAETQLSLFSNVSSYGLDPDEFEFYSFNDGVSFGSWEERKNLVYGSRYQAKQTEEVQESGIRLTAFPCPYSFPFGPNFAKIGLYNVDLFNRYTKFIQLGNDLYQYFDGASGSTYPSSWKEKFLPSSFARVESGDVNYAAGIVNSFARIDTWTDTWRDIKDSLLIDPVTNQIFNFTKVSSILSSSYDATSTRPGYSDSNRRYAFLQSRRVFRYQPGRISGFTFGLRSSTEPVTGITLEWGISNPTDQYVFRIDAGQFSIIRRSTIPLEKEVLERNGLRLSDQTRITSGDPFDSEQYWTISIPRDKFNGDPLNSNGPSGYLLQPEKVTMYKIEFGWYGAIGARFYVYIPTDNGDARWVVVHTLVIENSLGSPCLQDSYFRFKYSLNIANTGDVRSPQYLYKYGASYYIDGGDEGSSQIYSVSSREKTILSANEKTLLGIRPKDFILNRDSVKIKNKKLIIPIKLNVTSNSLSQIKVVTCTACPGFGYAYTPGIATTESGRYVNIEFTDANTISAINNSYFLDSDIGAKLIAPSIFNLYITNVSDPVGVGNSYGKATVKGFGGTGGSTLVSRNIPGSQVYDYAAGISTIIRSLEPYPYPVRLSNYNAYAASDFKFTGSNIEIQFVNPANGDSYAHFADFLIGVTDKQPDVSLPNTLNGFIIGAATTTVLPNENIIFGEHTHAYASLDEKGIEGGETINSLKMTMDYRIPSLANPAGGTCSKVTVSVSNPIEISNSIESSVNPQTGANDGNLYIRIPGTFPQLKYNGGQIALKNSSGVIVVTNATYVNEPVGPYFISGVAYSHIRISQTTGLTNFSLLLRPVVIIGNQVNSGKLFNYNPFPLYLVVKLKDNSQINNISVMETIGDFQRTISPKWYVNSKATPELYGGKTDNTGTATTNFLEINRNSSALIDIQNDQQLRPSTTRDIFYVGANDTTSIDMSKVFGADRRVITPDNNNIEATFIVAKKIDSGSSGTLQTSLNFKEQ